MVSKQGSDAVRYNLPQPIRDASVRRTWRAWGGNLRRRHLDGVAAALLEAGAPLALVCSQLLLVGRPLFGEVASQLAAILESEQETAAFRDYLIGMRTETTSTIEGGP